MSASWSCRRRPRMSRPLCPRRRRAITLFEVVVALVIFLVTLPALNTLVQIGVQRAEQSHQMARASMECRSKLAEVTVGAEPLDPMDWTSMSDPNWFWKLDVSDAEATGLKQVYVSVKFDSGAGAVTASLSTMILDPAMRGSTQDRGLLQNSSTTPSSSSGTGSTGTGGTAP